MQPIVKIGLAGEFDATRAVKVGEIFGRKTSENNTLC
jgi:hypothetical protein